MCVSQGLDPKLGLPDNKDDQVLFGSTESTKLPLHLSPCIHVNDIISMSYPLAPLNPSYTILKYFWNFSLKSPQYDFKNPKSNGLFQPSFMLTSLQGLILWTTFPFPKLSPPSVSLISCQSSSYFSDHICFLPNPSPRTVLTVLSSCTFSSIRDEMLLLSSYKAGSQTFKPVPTSDQKFSPVFP